MQTIANRYYEIAVRIANLFYLNILWIVFTILGLGFLGFFPSTIAMFSVIRKWIVTKHKVPIFKLFWQTYTSEFFKANGYGYIFVVIGYLLLVSYRILLTQQSIHYIIGGYIIVFMLLICLVAITYFFPIYVHFDLETLEYIKWSFIFSINHPLMSFLLVGGTTLINYLMFNYLPGILFFLGGSLSAFIINWVVSKIYPIYSMSESESVKKDTILNNNQVDKK